MLKRLWKCERGSTALLAAMMIMVLLAFAGLLIDGGMMMYNKCALDEATSAAAEAVLGAVDTENSTAENIIIKIDTAQVLAQKVLDSNLNPSGRPEMKTYSIVSCVIDPEASNRIILHTKMIYQPYFAKVLHVDSLTLEAKCTGKVTGTEQ